MGVVFSGLGYDGDGDRIEEYCCEGYLPINIYYLA
jgi:hypothetical protein